MFNLISSINANVAMHSRNIMKEDGGKSSSENNISLFGSNSNGNSLTLADDLTPLAEKYKAASYDDIERAGGNGLVDVDARQGEIGDCNLLATLRALRNSENGQKALSEVMKYDAENASWSFNFKTKDFAKEDASPVVITKDEVDKAIAEKKVSKGDDDVSAIELAVAKYLGQVHKNGTEDNIMKQISDQGIKHRTARGAAADDYLNGVVSHIGYLFTGNISKSIKGEEDTKNALADFDKTTDMMVFAQIGGDTSAKDTFNGGGSNANPFVMLGDDQILGNHAYTVCDVSGDQVTLRESNNPSATITATIEELLNCTGNNYFYTFSY